MSSLDDLFGKGWRDTTEMVEWRRRHERADRLTRWMDTFPVVGGFVRAFWYCVLTEGVVSTCKPRWGAMTFGYLNDGIRPTVWHTWRQVTHDHRDPYTGIYPSGAPRSETEAEEWANR